MLVRGRMMTEVVTAPPTMSLDEAVGIMRDHRIRHLPVMDGDRVVGIVGERVLLAAADAAEPKTLADVMAVELVTISPDAPVEEAAKLMYLHRVNALPVLESERLVGVISSTDVLRAFVELFGLNGPSSRLEIRMPNRPGELARVVRLIGIDFKINILGMVIPPLEGGVSMPILHLHSAEPEDLVEALRKLGYEAGSPAIA